MAKNSNLHKAKTAKNDEFYTRLTDIEKEMQHYRNHFNGKVVYCNCDDARESKFFEYFSKNFEYLGLKKLICTGYKPEGNGVALIYEGDKNGNRKVDNEEIKVIELNGTGDFRSEECVEFLKEADIVVTNPPFSLFREYVAQLMEYDKKFLIVGNSNAITYKEIFPLIKENKLWLGCVNPKAYITTLKEVENEKTQYIENGVVYQKFGNHCWFTNLEHKKRNEALELTKKYSNECYPKYDNYDAIEVGQVVNIPMDYDGVMGVPISFLDKYNPNQFEIVAFRKGNDGKDLVFTIEREREFNHTFVSLYEENKLNTLWTDEQSERYKSEWEKQIRKNTNKKIEPIDICHPITCNLKNGMINNQTINGKKGYCRILIRHKK